MLADTSFPSTRDVQNASRLYALRDGQERNLARKRPRCARCGVKLLLVRVSGGFSTCFRCDDFDPRHELAREKNEEKARKALASRAASRNFGGCVVPGGGARAKRLRTEAGFTIVGLSKAIGVSHSMVQRWESGERVVLSEAMRAVEKACEDARANANEGGAG